MQTVGTDLVSRGGSLQKQTAGVDTQTVSGRGFTSLQCRRFCSTEIQNEPQSSREISCSPATLSISITYNQQNSIDFSTNGNLFCKQGVRGSNPLTSTNLFADCKALKTFTTASIRVVSCTGVNP